MTIVLFKRERKRGIRGDVRCYMVVSLAGLSHRAVFAQVVTLPYAFIAFDFLTHPNWVR